MNRIAVMLFLLFVFSNNIFSQKSETPSFTKRKLEEQKVSLVARGVPLVQVLDYLQKHYSITFSYSDDLIPTQKIIYVSLNKQYINTALEKILFGTTVSYKIIGETVVLKNDKQYTQQEIVSIDSIKKVMHVPGTSHWVRKYRMGDFFSRKNSFEKKYQRYLKSISGGKVSLHRKDSTTSKKDSLKKIFQETIIPDKQRYWEVEISTVPLKIGRILEARTDAGVDLLNSKNSNESNSFNFSYSANLKFHFLRNFYIASGLLNHNFSIYYTTVKYFPLQKMEIQEQKSFYKQKWHYLGIPVLLGADIGVKRWNFALEVGFTPSILFSSPLEEQSTTNNILTLDKDNRPPHKKVKDVLLIESIEAPQLYRKLTGFVTGNFTISFTIGKNLKLFTGPYFITSVNSIYDDSVTVIEKLYGIGGNAGIRLKLF